MHLKVQFQLYYCVRLMLNQQAHLKCIDCCSVSTLLSISKRAKKYTLTLIFQLTRFCFCCTYKSIFERILKCLSDRLSYKTSIISCGEPSATLLCSSRSIIACTLMCTMISTNLCILYSAGITLYACAK